MGRAFGAISVAVTSAALSAGCAETVADPAAGPWVRHLATLENTDAYESRAALAARGESYVASPWTGELTPGAPGLVGDNVGAHQSYVAALDARGAPRWTRALRGAPYVSVTRLAVDEGGGVYAVGYAAGGVDLGDDAGLRPGGAFALRYDRDGSVRWVVRVADDPAAHASAAAADAAGNIYVAVILPGATTVAGVPARDAALASFDRDGRARWVLPLAGADGVYDLAVDASGGVVAPVPFRRALTVAGRTLAAPEAPAMDAAVVALTRDGALRWLRELRSTGSELILHVAAAPGGEIAVGGRWSAGADGGALTVDGRPLASTGVGSAVLWLGGDGTLRRGRFLPSQTVRALAFDAAGALWYGGRADEDVGPGDATPPLRGGVGFVAGLGAEGPAAVVAQFAADGGAWVSGLSHRDGVALVTGSGAGVIRHRDASFGAAGFGGFAGPTSTFAARLPR